ncbi:hypothetical protein K2173_003298 [Erythroxylum novogranatense]|uniref:Uncharacterized protein n=1 Tax=Erythroxylum novogranatense TaxID=1862640 RepID=A0AAV8SYI0_9ROSI|nr:hypothetical protein K2173_003298 [Erythroxylum novogranatense]
MDSQLLSLADLPQRYASMSMKRGGGLKNTGKLTKLKTKNVNNTITPLPNFFFGMRQSTLNHHLADGQTWQGSTSKSIPKWLDHKCCALP